MVGFGLLHSLYDKTVIPVRSNKQKNAQNAYMDMDYKFRAAGVSMHEQIESLPASTNGVREARYRF